MNFKDINRTGFSIVDEVVTFRSYADPVSGLTDSFAKLQYRPGLQTLKFYSSTLLSGTQYPVQLAGTTALTGKVLVLDPINGYLIKHSTVATAIYATYTGFASPVGAFEMNQVSEDWILLCYWEGSMADGDVLFSGLDYSIKMRFNKIKISARVLPSSTATIRVSNAAEDSAINTTISTAGVNANNTGTIDIATTSSLQAKCITNAGIESIHIWARKTLCTDL